ncbi:hypothetical protein CWO07_07220 [Vibrio splendidus]|uniref:Uncharacterized protein n=1 Tax=Vibrio splendidus TaxID=29497 RepID=A0A2T5EY60_VIBSP|nr:hypothetical protein CWO07_07220 [Vibrio splendidus]
MVALNKINTFVIYRQVGLIQGLKDEWIDGWSGVQWTYGQRVMLMWYCRAKKRRKSEEVSPTGVNEHGYI